MIKQTNPDFIVGVEYIAGSQTSGFTEDGPTPGYVAVLSQRNPKGERDYGTREVWRCTHRHRQADGMSMAIEMDTMTQLGPLGIQQRKEVIVTSVPALDCARSAAAHYYTNGPIGLAGTADLQ